MLILNKVFGRLSVNFLHVAKCSTVSLNNSTDLKSLPISSKDKEKVLNTLNEFSREELSNKIDISQTRLKNLEKWKSRYGPFRSLDEVLEVDGLSEKVLQKICKNIIEDWSSANVNKPTKSAAFKIKQLLTPSLPDGLEDTLETAVGIHLNTTGVSWAKMHRGEKMISQWNYEVFNVLPKKMLLTETFYMAKEILSKIPRADVYVFEGSTALNPQGQTQMSAVMSYIQNLGLTSMLLALLNTSAEHNTSDDNRVFHLRSRIPARLFGTLVGGEKVAAITRISPLIYPCSEGFSLPCTKVSIEESERVSFGAQNSANKELLGQSLMLVVAFMDLCVYTNPDSFRVLLPGKKNNVITKNGNVQRVLL